MDTKKLKQKILDLAIRGKLVAQDPNDEPALVLLEQIHQEKERLIRERKIKRDKNESQIYRSGKSYYEKRGSEVRCIDDEIPFEIPDSWAWCRLGHVGQIVGGGTPDTKVAEYWNGDVNWISPADLSDHLDKYITKGRKCITQLGLANSSAHLMPQGSILYSSRAPIGYCVIASSEISTNQGFKSIVPSSFLFNEFLYYYLIAFTSHIQSVATGTTFKEISGGAFAKTMFMLPPLSEQTRIVESIEQAFALIDSIEADKSALSKAIKQTKAKVLDLAIRGKLVPQDPSDEPASILLERIKAEKLASAKGSKKQQKQPARTSDNSHYENMPFEIPESWSWVDGYTCFCPMESIKPSGGYFRYIDIDAIDNLNHKVKTPKIADANNAPSRASRRLHSGDVVFSLVRPYLGNIAYIDNKLADCIASTGFYVCTPCKGLLLSMYCYYLMISTYVIDGLTQYMKGDNSPSITNDNILNWVFPIPPLPEQKKIINKIDALMSSINIIEENL